MSKTFNKSRIGLEKDKDLTKSFIAPGAELDVNLFKSSGSVTINGVFKGKLEVAKDTEILSEGVIIGDISTCNAIISGSIKGIIESGGYLEATQTANIEGDIVASSIEVEHGAIINGMVTIRPKQSGQLVSIKNVNETIA